MAVLGAALVMYVKMRSFLAVDQLVRIYREVSRDLFCAACTPGSLVVCKIYAWLRGCRHFQKQHMCHLYGR